MQAAIEPGGDRPLSGGKFWKRPGRIPGVRLVWGAGSYFLSLSLGTPKEGDFSLFLQRADRQPLCNNSA